MGGWRAGATSIDVKATVSTGSTTESDADLTAGVTQEGPSGTQGPRQTNGKRKQIVLTSNTIHYLNVMTASGANAVQFLNGTSRANLRAICAYL